MLASTSLSQKNQSAAPPTRNTLIVSGVMIGAMLALMGWVLYSGPVNTPQATLVFSVAVVIGVAALLGAGLSWFGQPTGGAWITLLAFALGMGSFTLVLAGIGVLLAVGTFAVLYVLAFITLAPNAARQFLIFAGVLCLGMIGLDLFPFTARTDDFIIKSNTVNSILVIVLGVFGPLGAWQLQRAQLPVKLGFVLVIFVVGFSAFGVSALAAMNQVQIGGDLFHEIEDGAVLIADIVPPPASLLEIHLNTDQIRDAVEEEDSQAEIEELAAQAVSLREQFVARHEFWQAHFREHGEGENIRLKLQEAYTSGLRYLQARDARFIPAVLAGDLEEAGKVYDTELAPLFAQENQAILETVRLTEARNALVEEEANTTVTTSVTTVTTLGLITSALGLVIVYLIGRSIVNPINQLTRSAEGLARGEPTSALVTGGTDEIGVLGQTFNSMAAQVRESLTSLEQRVTARTTEMKLAAQVGRELVQKGELKQLLKNAVEVVVKDFGLYAAQVYLLDPNSQLLVLRASSGEVGDQMVQRGHRLALGLNSLNSKAATERRPALASNTALDPNFKSNPLRPNIRSEVAVPLISNDQLLGVLDLQSDEAGRFTPENIGAVQLLAEQVVFALRNADLLNEAEQARLTLQEQAQRLTRQGWQDFLNAIQRHERLEAAYYAPDSLFETETRAVSTPIEIAGQQVGGFTLELPKESEASEEVRALMEAAATVVAQQVDNLRLLAQGEQYRYEAEEAVRRLTQEGWQSYVQADTAKLVEGFAYDGTLVQQTAQVDLPPEMSAQALVLRGVPVGEILVDKEALTSEAEQILASVSDQLTAHIESLRLAEQTQTALAETAKLYDTSTKLTTAQSLADIAQAFAQALPNETIRVRLFKLELAPSGAPEWGELAATWNYDGAETLAVGTRFRFPDYGFAKYWMSRPDKATLIEDVETDARLDEDTRAGHRTLGTRSLAVLPLYLVGQWVGLLSITWHEAHRVFTPDDERLFAAQAAQAAVVMNNRLLFEQTQAALIENERRNATLAALNRVVSAAAGARDVAGLLGSTAQEILQTLNARNCGIAVFTDTSRSQLRVLADANANPADASAVGIEIPVAGNTSTEYVMTNRRSLSVSNAQTDPRTASVHELMRGRGTVGLMIVPLLSRGEVIGTIGVDSDDVNRAFTTEEVALVETMAGQLAGAIDNLRLFEDTQKRAQREALINDITAKIQGTVTVDSALQTTIQELGRALKARKTRVALGLTATQPETNGHS